MKEQDLLHLAALLHDIGKFRRRATANNDKPHQEHSHAFVTEDFRKFFAPCEDTYTNAILNHHTEGSNPIEKQVILADKLSAIESESKDSGITALTTILSQLKGAENTEKTYQYPITALDFEKPDTVLPVNSTTANQKDYENLWEDFSKAFNKVTERREYTPHFYQTLVALLHKYTSRMPSELTEADISLYDHLRTTAAIAACIGRELTKPEEVVEQLTDLNGSDKKICALIKGDISGIQSFLYQILSDGAARRLRGRSFYLQLLTEAIAHYVLNQLDLPITNLLLASGGQFYILAPYTDTKDKFNEIRKQIAHKLLQLHQGDLYCILDYTDVKVSEYAEQNFANKWGEVSENVHKRKQKKWSELGNKAMFNNLFKPQKDKVEWDFRELGSVLRNAEYLIVFDVPESDVPETPEWHSAIKAFGLDIHICNETDKKPEPEQATKATVYRIGNTDFLSGIDKYHWEGIPVSYDFRIFRPVIAHTEDEKTADYNAIVDASEGVDWLGALRMDVDNLGMVFTEKLQNATISRLATLSEALRLFFEGYVPAICDEHNKNKAEILELIYAGGDDLFLVGGWSALPEIAEQIRSDFRKFVTGEHVTLSGGIAIEHQKFPLYLFADLSGDAEKASKNIDKNKNAITFLRKPMKWEDFAIVREWHQKFMKALNGDKPLPRDILTRLSQIYSEEELKGHRWAWRSLYYFHRLKERNKNHDVFLNKLQNELNNPKKLDLKQFVHVITRWTALRIRK